MPTKPSPFWLRIMVAVHRVAARTMPRKFRERFGEETEEAFTALIVETHSRKGGRAALSMAAAACRDTAGAGLGEHASSWRATLFTGLQNDLVQASRVFLRQPIHATAIAATLALASGPTLAILLVLHLVVFGPLPYADADRLVVVSHRSERGSNIYSTAATVDDYRAVDAFEAVGGVKRMVSPVSLGSRAERLGNYETTAGFLTQLGIPFLAGRDLERGQAEVVVTRAFARLWFPQEADALGSTLLINKNPMTIVGVIDARPVLPGPPIGIDLFVSFPLSQEGRLIRGGTNTIVIARLKEAVNPDVALERVNVVADQVRQHFGRRLGVPELVPLRTAISGDLRSPLLILSAIVLVTFGIAVASIGALVLARAAARAPDIAVRRALGASRWRLVRAWLTDGLVVALPGIACGVWLCLVCLEAARRNIPEGVLPLPENPSTGQLLAAAACLLLLTTTLFASAPMAAGLLRSTHMVLRDAMIASASLRRVRWQSALIWGQVTTSVILVASAALLAASLWRIVNRPLGFDPAGVAIVATDSVTASMTGNPAAVVEGTRQARARLAQITGGRVAAASTVPVIGGGFFSPRRIKAGEPAFDRNDAPTLARFAVSSNYFDVLGIPLLDGRTFTAADETSPHSAIIVSESFAARWFPEGALGQMVTLADSDRREIVGIVADVHAARLDSDNVPQFYVPMTETTLGTANNYVVRTSLPVAQVQELATAIVRERDPSATVRVIALPEAMAMRLILRRTASLLTAMVALSAILLAIVNIYALSAYSVVQRTREIGIRLALGATAVQAQRLVMQRALMPVAAGLVIGGAVALMVAAPTLETQLFQTSPRDPWLFAIALGFVLLVSTAAAWLPARRAASLDAAITLRAE